MFWTRNAKPLNTEFVSLYKGEDLHPTIQDAMDWAYDNVFNLFMPGSRDSVAAKSILAGGSILSYFTGTQINDFDMYFRSKDDYNYVRSNVSNAFMLVPTSSERSDVYRRTISVDGKLEMQVLNLIKDKFFETPEAVIANFDFTVCQCAITADSIVYHPQYFIDVATKSLRVYNTDHPTGSLYRMQKYVQRGYKMDQENMHKLLEAVQDGVALPNIYTEEDQKLDAQVVSTLYGGS